MHSRFCICIKSTAFASMQLCCANIFMHSRTYVFIWFKAHALMQMMLQKIKHGIFATAYRSVHQPQRKSCCTNELMHNGTCNHIRNTSPVALQVMLADTTDNMIYDLQSGRADAILLRSDVIAHAQERGLITSSSFKAIGAVSLK